MAQLLALEASVRDLAQRTIDAAAGRCARRDPVMPPSSWDDGRGGTSALQPSHAKEAHHSLQQVACDVLDPRMSASRC